MFYAWDITVTANTLESAPKTLILKLTKGTIRGIDVVFGAGCRRLVKVRLFRYESQLVPLNLDDWVTGENATVPTETYYELMAEPYQLKFLAISPGTSYDHKITVRIRVEPPEVAAPWEILRDFIAVIKRLLGV